jgi:hypothetical protein
VSLGAEAQSFAKKKKKRAAVRFIFEVPHLNGEAKKNEGGANLTTPAWGQLWANGGA